MYSRSTWKVLPTLALRAVVHLGCASLLAKIFARFVIKECSIEGRWEAVKKSTHVEKRIPAFLALAAEAFRGDLEELVRSGKLRILRINLSALHRLTYVFLDKYIQDGKAPSPERYYHASDRFDEEFFADKGYRVASGGKGFHVLGSDNDGREVDFG